MNTTTHWFLFASLPRISIVTISNVRCAYRRHMYTVRPRLQPLTQSQHHTAQVYFAFAFQDYQHTMTDRTINVEGALPHIHQDSIS